MEKELFINADILGRHVQFLEFGNEEFQKRADLVQSIFVGVIFVVATVVSEM